ncbi:neurotrimin-like [Cimex lectularius]|uniref:Ig-like domain-containing protein n=1 Tax=Cimex lectularius TaxID=79782 RepID=A0A8I6SH21_CIMLE|nr:neurotrimin-like [Cimex lectularius]
MDVMLIILSICLHAYSAKEIDRNQDPNLDDLLKMLWMETTTQKSYGYPDRTTLSPPYFENGPNPVNNTVQLGAEITLHCKVNDLSEQMSVSWLKRHGDKLNLLSVGLEMYSSDTRFAPQFKAPNDWQLRLTPAEQADQGQYECQVSSHPPITQIFFLTVVVPELNIADERGLPIKNKFYNSGSTIELKCIISKVPEPTHLIMWRIGEKVLNYDTTRGGISVKTDISDDGALSRLFIANSNQHDSGNYTCSLGELAHSSVAVVVLNGEAPAAMHVGISHRLTACNIFWVLPFILLIYSR